MSLSSRLNRLRAEAAKLHTAIHDESTRPLPDHVRLSHLKRRKLAVRDEIWRAEVRLLAAQPAVKLASGAHL